ncbi:hypothetical protein BC939DRAFT_445021 [Gamsiella multidivaricata]|uniref:uncharacterized protein n=1 Tax=Gamsiella multidivaricata TaxID=101098 RepID=UPI0022212215|nr:uncharacterized protein BC939DRAFT_445021 [Gamsiella multidivaricata]KAG0365059.1 hypothetical protein BGZ54_006914 [Gamsiella multidivaricata]KAI7827692.1 hypothetical protein BC939DRAFT_445021 [Gamsiella multidivaricata]
MLPKRANPAGKPALSVKRVKAASYGNSDSDSEDTYRPQKKTLAKMDLPNMDDAANEEEESLIRHYSTKQPQAKSKKKISPEYPTAASELALTKSQQQQRKQPKSAPPAALSRQSSALKSKASHDNQENVESPYSTFVSSTKSKGIGKESARTTSSMTAEQLVVALDELNVKYKRLKQLRMTEAEKNLEDCRAKLEEATRSAENYRAQMELQLESALRTQEKLRDNSEVMNAKVRTLQRQVRDCEGKLRQHEQEDRVRAKTASMQSVLASPDVTPNTAATVSTIKMYENLSGFKLVPRDIFPGSSKNKLPTIWDCEQTGPRGTLHFTLTYDYENNLVSYSPSIDEKRDEKLLKSLPDYLTDDIEFERQFESKFFWRMLNFNNEDEI